MKDMHRLVTKLNRYTIHLVRSSVLDQCVRSIHVLTDLLLVNDVTICTAITLLCYREQIGGQSIFIMVKKCSYLPFNLWNNICMFTPPRGGGASHPFKGNVSIKGLVPKISPSSGYEVFNSNIKTCLSKHLNNAAIFK